MDSLGLKNHPQDDQSTVPGAALSEDRGQFSSLSHSPSPKIASILIHPSDSGASRPRSSEGRLNLPKDTHSKGHRVVSPGLKKRSIGAQVEKVLEKEPSVKTDPFLNFGIGDGFPYSEDPLILEDVQKALNAKARRSNQHHSPSIKALQESGDSSTTPQLATYVPSRTTLPANVSTVISPGQSLSKTRSKGNLPSSRHASSLSLQSNSSEELPSKSPVPMLISFPDGTSCLDWSGNITSTNPQSKDKTNNHRSFSLSIHKFKTGEHSRNGGSLSQKDFHVALLDNVRRVAKRNTLFKAEKTKEELSRRYSFLSSQDPITAINPLVVIRTRQDDPEPTPPWYFWRSKRPSRISRWTLTANNFDEYMSSIGVPFPHIDSNRSRSPVSRFSPLSSPRPSFSSSPSSRKWKETKPMEFNPSLSTSITEVVNFSSRPALSPNSNTLPTSSHVSLQMPTKNATEPINTVSVASGSSEDAQRERSPIKTEGGQSFGRRLRVSLSALAKDPTNPSATSRNTHFKGTYSTSNQPTIIRHSFENVRKSGDEAISSISDEGDSFANISVSKREPEKFTKKSTSLTVPVDMHKSKSDDRSKIGNTSESETGITSFHPYRSRDRSLALQGSLSAEERQNSLLGVSTWHLRRHSKIPDVKDPREELERLLQLEEEEEKIREIYSRRERLLIEANDHNRKIARLLKSICNSLKEYQRTQSALGVASTTHHHSLPHEVVEAIYSDPATTLRHGKGWKAVEDSYSMFHTQQAALSSYVSQLSSTPSSVITSKLETSIDMARYLWENLQKASEQVESRIAMVEPALNRAMEHVENVQKEYNRVEMLSETDYPENQAISDLETYILESQIPRGWLEFIAVWVPVHVLEAFGGFIRFFGVPISEKFIRPFLWYFFRNQYYWKLYSTEPPSSERTWYTRLAYWLVVISILAWCVTPRSEVHVDV